MHNIAQPKIAQYLQHKVSKGTFWGRLRYPGAGPLAGGLLLVRFERGFWVWGPLRLKRRPGHIARRERHDQLWEGTVRVKHDHEVAGGVCAGAGAPHAVVAQPHTRATRHCSQWGTGRPSPRKPHVSNSSTTHGPKNGKVPAPAAQAGAGRLPRCTARPRDDVGGREGATSRPQTPPPPSPERRGEAHTWSRHTPSQTAGRRGQPPGRGGPEPPGRGRGTAARRGRPAAAAARRGPRCR